jgi:nucleoid-associated protein YgaU
MHTLIRFQGLRRRSILVVVVAALLLSLMPTAAFASSGGHFRQQRFSQQHRQFNRHAPQRHQFDRHAPQRHFNRCDATYRVHRGDTLSGISRHFRVSVRELANTNGIRNPNRIFAGTKLCISH